MKRKMSCRSAGRPQRIFVLRSRIVARIAKKSYLCPCFSRTGRNAEFVRDLPGRDNRTKTHVSNPTRIAVMSAPLAERLRPRTMDEYIGQEHLVGKNGVFRKFFETGNVPSFILWGAPGAVSNAHL